MKLPGPASARALVVAATCAVLWGLAAGARAEGRLELIFAADLAGDFYAQECGQAAPRPGGGLGGLASAIAAVKAQSPAALVLGGGGLLGPGVGARFLLHSVSGSRGAAHLMREAGLEIISPGVHELSIARETLISYLDELRASGPAPLLSNVECDKALPELCRLLAPRQLITRGGVRVGVLAALPEDAAQRIGPGHLHGAKVTPWARLGNAARELRRQVDVLIIELDLGEGFGIDAAIELARSLDAAGGHADVLHLSRQDDPRGGVLSLRLSSGALLVGSPARGTGVTQVSVVLRPGADGERPALDLHEARVPAPIAATPATPLAQSLARARDEMCAQWGKVLTELPAPGLDRAAVTRLVLDAMREVAHAELALINSGAVSDRGLPLRVASISSVGDVLPFKAQVLASTLSGQAITDALQKYAGQEPGQRLRISGLTKKDGNLLVNGRPLSVTARYRVATIDFLAAGGNGLLPAKFLPAKNSVVADDLRQLVLTHLGQHAGSVTVPAPLRLERRPLWRVALDLGVDLQNVSVSNPGNAYDRPQLVRQPSLAFKLDGMLRAEMDHPVHLAQLTLRTQYGQSWLRTTAAPDPSMPTDPQRSDWIGQETADLINLLALYSYRGFSERQPRLPTPYLSLGLESEFNRPDTRAYLHFELSGVLGLRLALPASITATLGAGVRSELLASASSDNETERALARARLLLTTLIEMPKRTLLPRLGSALLGEFAVSYSVTDVTMLRSHELRGTGKLYIALGRPLYLTLSSELYVYRDRDNEAGVALDLNVGLKVVLSGHRQQF